MILTAHFCSKPKRLFGRASHPIIPFCIIKASTRDESCFHFTAALWTEMFVHTQNFVLETVLSKSIFAARRNTP